jgi:hypothetical protein
LVLSTLNRGESWSPEFPLNTAGFNGVTCWASDRCWAAGLTTGGEAFVGASFLS